MSERVIAVRTAAEALLAGEVLALSAIQDGLIAKAMRDKRGLANYRRYRDQHRALIRAHKALVREFRTVKKRYDAALKHLTPESRMALRLELGRRV